MEVGGYNYKGELKIKAYINSNTVNILQIYPLNGHTTSEFSICYNYYPHPIDGIEVKNYEKFIKILNNYDNDKIKVIIEEIETIEVKIHHILKLKEH